MHETSCCTVAAALGRLREAAKQARAWLERAEAPSSGPAELRVLEALTAEAGVYTSPLNFPEFLCIWCLVTPRTSERVGVCLQTLCRVHLTSSQHVHLALLSSSARSMAAARCSVALPSAKPMRERVTAARRLGEAIRAALPSSREPTRAPRARTYSSGAQPMDVDFLRYLAARSTLQHELMIHNR